MKLQTQFSIPNSSRNDLQRIKRGSKISKKAIDKIGIDFSGANIFELILKK